MRIPVAVIENGEGVRLTGNAWKCIPHPGSFRNIRVTEPPSDPLVCSTFAYDYRSRRYFRSTPSGTNLCVFDGGLSVQEYSVATDSDPLSSTNLTTEYVRGEGMGGGVGMVYSIKKDDDGNSKLICSHANHRGDVIARSDSTGSLTSFALYEAYGTRPYEWGDDPDRQKANTKEEETDLGLLNEGMRYRDLETGTFLTRDPIGYADGPNAYCYVHCNPITMFDPLGLSGWLTISVEANGETRSLGSMTIEMGQHAWVEYTRDSDGAHATYGTWGNTGGPGRKLGVNANQEKGRNATHSRSVWINDKQEAKLEKHINKQAGKGSKAWSKRNNCSKFAEKTWNKVTKDSVDAIEQHSFCKFI